MWATYERNAIWIYERTHFKRCPATAVITVMDLVDARRAGHADRCLDAAVAVLEPILLAVSDNGPQMTSGSTREFMAMCAIAQLMSRILRQRHEERVISPARGVGIRG